VQLAAHTSDDAILWFVEKLLTEVSRRRFVAATGTEAIRAAAITRWWSAAAETWPAPR
jgi:hypothetical protein